MKKMSFIFTAIFFILIFSLNVSAHPGKTDSSGGHYDHSTGEYHYHHGYPAHQHPDGVCPYDNVAINSDQSSDIVSTSDIPSSTFPYHVILVSLGLILVIALGSYIFVRINSVNKYCSTCIIKGFPIPNLSDILFLLFIPFVAALYYLCIQLPFITSLWSKLNWLFCIICIIIFFLSCCLWEVILQKKKSNFLKRPSYSLEDVCSYFKLGKYKLLDYYDFTHSYTLILKFNYSSLSDEIFICELRRRDFLSDPVVLSLYAYDGLIDENFPSELDERHKIYWVKNGEYFRSNQEYC